MGSRARHHAGRATIVSLTPTALSGDSRTLKAAMAYTRFGFESVVIEGVAVDAKRSFTEVYSSTPEPKIPVCITYYWKVFKASATTAKLTVSDWQSEQEPGAPFGQEQTFNFLEIQPYRE